MSNPIKAALAKEQAKLVRQLENHEATKAVIEILGDTPKERGKLDRQEAAINETRANIDKLEKAISALDKKKK